MVYYKPETHSKASPAFLYVQTQVGSKGTEITESEKFLVPTLINVAKGKTSVAGN